MTADSLYITLTETTDPATREFVRGQLRAFNDRCSPPHRALRGVGKAPLDIVIRDPAGEIVAGLIGATGWGWLEVDTLWVAEALRGQGHGRGLLRMAEAEAQRRGCSHAMLTTFSFQARGFYEREGYRVVGEMVDYPPGAVYYWMRKDFEA